MVTQAWLILAAAASGQTAETPLVPAFLTGKRLYEICTLQTSGNCWMYVSGVLDGVFLVESKSADRSICPAPLTNRDAAERVTNFLRDNPAYMDRAAAVGVRAALQTDLPCAASDGEASGE